MGDFVTRLAERTLGVAPVVQPLLSPTFAPEPADKTGRSWPPRLGPGAYPPSWETTTSRDDWGHDPAPLAPPERPADAGGRPPSRVAPTTPEPTTGAPPVPHRVPAHHDRSADTSPSPPEGYPDRSAARRTGTRIEQDEAAPGTSRIGPELSASAERPTPPAIGHTDERDEAAATPDKLRAKAETRPGSRLPGAPASPEHPTPAPIGELRRGPSPDSPRKATDLPDPHHDAEPGTAGRDEAAPTSRPANIPAEPRRDASAASHQLSTETREDPPGPTGRRQAPPTKNATPGRSGHAARPKIAPPPATIASPQRIPEPRSGETGSAEREVVPENKGPQDVLEAEHSRKRPETRPDVSRRAKPERRLVPPGQPRAPLEGLFVDTPPDDDGSDRARLRPTGTPAEQGRDVVSLPDTPAEAVRDARKSVTVPNRPEPLGDPSVAPRVSRPGSGNHQQPGTREPSAPAIRVSIGRIEVRAATPPPVPAAQPAASARPGPALSLDDYLKRRNGGQR